ncbi:MAG: hypothetical protein RLZZ200_2287, partial [Pseudomonadota bacterium]
LQSLNVLEDDRRDWKKGQRKFLQKTLSPRLEQSLKAGGLSIDWDVVARQAHEARGLPLPVTRSDVRSEDVIASAPRVENRIPRGSNWDGADDPARADPPPVARAGQG